MFFSRGMHCDAFGHVPAPRCRPFASPFLPMPPCQACSFQVCAVSWKFTVVVCLKPVGSVGPSLLLSWERRAVWHTSENVALWTACAFKNSGLKLKQKGITPLKERMVRCCKNEEIRRDEVLIWMVLTYSTVPLGPCTRRHNTQLALGVQRTIMLCSTNSLFESGLPNQSHKSILKSKLRCMSFFLHIPF